MAIPAFAKDGAKLSVPTLAISALPAWMRGILMISLLSATLSTSSQLILATTHMIVHDIFKKAVSPNMSDKTFLTLTRVMIFVCALLVAIPALRVLNQDVMSIFFWTFSFGIPVFGVYLIGMVWKVNRDAAWITMIAGYGANFLWTFIPKLVLFLPEQMRQCPNVYATIIATLFVGIVLNLVLPGQPGYIHQMKEAESNI